MAAKRIFSHYSSTTSAHGLPHIGGARNPCLCIFWLLIVLLATGAFVWQMWQLVDTYLSYQSNIQTQLNMGERPFPAVTVCNLNPYKKSAIKNTSIEGLMVQYAEAMRADNNSNRDTGNLTDYGLSASSIIGHRTKIQARTEDILVYLASTEQSIRTTATYKQDDMINSCVFNTHICNESDIQVYMDPVYGKCYTFNNMTPPYSASRPGPTYSLKLLLITEQTENLEMTELAGVRITIQGQGEPSFPDVYGYYAAPGYTNGFSVSYTKTIRAGAPYDPCIADSSEGTNNFYTVKYTTEACVRSYSQLFIMDHCHCVYPRYARPPSSTLPDCDMNSLDCVSEVLESEEYMMKVQQNCRNPCTEHAYSVAVSSAVWPGSYTPNTCNDIAWDGDTGKCVDWYGNNTMVIEIFYETMVYQVLNELPAYTLLNFISDIGGQMGLWLGFYAVTIFELIALIFSLFCFCCCGCYLPKAG